MIKCDATINFGQPALVGRRLTVYNIVTKIYYEHAIKSALDDYEILFQDALDAASYCMKLKCKEDVSLINYCDGCILRTIQEGWNFNREDYLEIEKHGQNFVISKDGINIFIGTLKELEDSEFGIVTWLIGEEVYNRLLDYKSKSDNCG